MKAFNDYLKCESGFWDEVRLVSESLGYSSNKILKIYNKEQIDLLESDLKIILNDKALLLKYLNERSEILNSKVQNFFMDKDEVKKYMMNIYTIINPYLKLL